MAAAAVDMRIVAVVVVPILERWDTLVLEIPLDILQYGIWRVLDLEVPPLLVEEGEAMLLP